MITHSYSYILYFIYNKNSLCRNLMLLRSCRYKRQLDIILSYYYYSSSYYYYYYFICCIILGEHNVIVVKAAVIFIQMRAQPIHTVMSRSMAIFLRCGRCYLFSYGIFFCNDILACYCCIRFRCFMLLRNTLLYLWLVVSCCGYCWSVLWVVLCYTVVCRYLVMLCMRCYMLYWHV